MRATDLVQPAPQGLYSPLGGFYVDPVRPVARALITHGHSDHARAGHGAVLATAETLGIMAVRYGGEFTGSTQIAAYGEPLAIDGVSVTFVPAGHVLGSAQIVLEAGDCRLVVSGDYKRERDPTCRPFEVVPCDIFITEATFGLPVFRHPPAADEIAKLMRSLALFPERAHLIGVYALGKAQRVMALLREAGFDHPIHIHGALERLTAYYADRGAPLGEVRKVALGRSSRTDPAYAGAVVLCPPGQIQDLWTRRFPDPVTAFASGWMRVRARARQRGVELPLVVSDHADWDALTATIRETGAREVWVTHGQEDGLVHWCTANGIAARPLNLVGYGDEEEDAAAELPADAAQAPAEPV